MSHQHAPTHHSNALTLIANPGSASRKYALYEGTRERASLHFEWTDGRVVCALRFKDTVHWAHVSLMDLSGAAAVAPEVLRSYGALEAKERITRIGLRIVAPGSYFLEDHAIDGEVITRLEALHTHAPSHIRATLDELSILRDQFPETNIIGVSDSAFHVTKPDYAWNYGISLEDADRFEIKRFGYHGLSVASTVRALQTADKLATKLVVCHLGSGVSVTAVLGGKSLDNTMGYSPLEGPIMSTRSGSIDPAAVRALKDVFRLDDAAADNYLNNHSGLLGLGGSSDLRELLAREAAGDARAQLALDTYIYSIQKAVGQMAAALGGLHALVFTGTAGERSAPIRERIISRLHYLDLFMDSEENARCIDAKKVTVVSRLAHSRPIYVGPTLESAEIARRVSEFSAHNG